MLSFLLAHTGRPVAPHDLWWAWSLEPFVLVSLASIALVYGNGCRSGDQPGRRRAFVGAVVALTIALVSPLDALAGSLASAHMVQHLLLVLVAAPLLVYSTPAVQLLRGAPPTVRRLNRRLGRRFRWRSVPPSVAGALAGLTFVVVIWSWHSRVMYELALEFPPVHAVEHATILGAGLLVWSVVRRAGSSSAEAGAGALLLFGLALQGTLLAALMSFSAQPWYPAYEDTAPTWGMSAMVDQQVAGMVLWFPSAAVYLGAGLWLLVRTVTPRADHASRRRPSGRVQSSSHGLIGDEPG